MKLAEITIGNYTLIVEQNENGFELSCWAIVEEWREVYASASIAFMRLAVLAEICETEPNGAGFKLSENLFTIAAKEFLGNQIET